MQRELTVIARIQSDFTTKFGIPRQSGLSGAQEDLVVFEPAYRDRNALRGLADYSHIWILWGFSANAPRAGFAPMVKPPRLGGNARMGVFATRSPNRPNPIGLSSVRLLGIEERPGLGAVLRIGGGDMMDGTPVYDIKPYLSFTDSHPDARDGFAGERLACTLTVAFPDELLMRIPEQKRGTLIEVLAQDPRPAYHDDPGTPYGFAFAGWDVRFRVHNGTITVFDVVRCGDAKRIK